jgi:hypothetical protein
MNETHNGDLNKSKAPARDKMEGTYGGKTDDAEATLRKGNLPKASAVTTLPVKGGDEAVKEAEKQNSSDGKPYLKGGRNVIPNESNEAVVCTCGCCCDCDKD